MLVEENCILHGPFARGSFPRMPFGARHTTRRCSATNIGYPPRQKLKIVPLAAAILIALCIKSNAQRSLSAAEIEDQIVGHSFQGKKGILSVSLHYAIDGTVTMRSPLGSGIGRWTLSNGRFCVKLETGPRKADECLTFVSQPDGAFQASNGMRLIPVE